MRKRYPQTLRMVLLFAVIGVVFAAEMLWLPTVYIVIGAVCVWLLIDAVRRDRKRKP